jgi:hypothetical protein
MQQDDRIFVVVGACIVFAVALVAALMWLNSGIRVDAPQRATVVVPQTAPTPEASVAPVSRVVEASLSDEGDEGLFRDAVARLSTHPVLASYLVHDRLLRRFVLAVNAIAGGYSPADEVDFLQPAKPFIVREDDEGRLVIASGSYRRYDVVAEVFTSLDSDGAIEIYRRFRPRLEAIYQEVGWANDDFDTRLREAVDHLLEVEAPGGQVEVEQRAIVYAYAEDRFENLTGAQKHFLRMGPRSVGAIQAKLRELRDGMGWPLPEPVIMTAELEQPAQTVASEVPLIADAVPLLAPAQVTEAAAEAEEPQ